jgi:chemotaxis protein histidine kinase CheA/ActR/RegA family two-component response regulator
MQLEAQQRILGYFIEEARDHLNTLEQGLMELRTPDEDGERMKELFRAAHSIKGGAGMLGLQAIRTVSHRLEDNFKTLQEQPIAISQTLESLLLRTVDILQSLLQQLQAPGGPNPAIEAQALEEAEPLMQRIERHLLGQPDLEEVPTIAEVVAPTEAAHVEELPIEEATPLTLELPETPATEKVIDDILSVLFGTPEGLARFTAGGATVEPLHSSTPEVLQAVDLSDLFAVIPPTLEVDEEHETAVPPEAPKATSVHQEVQFAAPSRTTPAANTRRTMRVEVRLLDGLNNMVGELVINRNSLETQQIRMRQFLETLQSRTQQLNRVSQSLAEHYDKTVLGIAAGGTVNSNAVPSSGGQTSYDDRSFDALEMDQYTAFHTISQDIMELIVRVKEVASDIEFVTDEADEATRQLRYISTQLQDGLNQIRMLPLAEIVDRLPRAVRDLSISLGKEVDLVLEGRDTLIDKAILEELYDPLTHLVTNALMHGMESPEVRTQVGKSAKGRIEVRAYHQGNQTLIAVSDDGRGLDAARIREKAIERGLITAEESQKMSDVELYPLIFMPGFSTAPQVTEIAGRGVGLDVVQSHLTRMRGTITIDSRQGQGTTFTIRLPLTLSISRAVLCMHSQSSIAIPLDGIEEMVEMPTDQIYTRDEQTYVRWRDQELRFIPLIDLLPYYRVGLYGNERVPLTQSTSASTVILRSGETYLAIQVDGFLEEQEIVIKQLRGPVQRPVGIAGATVLGNGKVLPIIDVLEIIGIATGQTMLMPWANLPEPTASSTPSQKTILIVDDSITVRELLSMTFMKVGYRVEQARDGQEAIEKLRSGLNCDAVFCDVEMPRMDGFEFLAQVQKDRLLNHLPVAMLTSRSADKHRQTAFQLGAKGYFTKPYLEDELLQGVVRLLQGEKVESAAS